MLLFWTNCNYQMSIEVVGLALQLMIKSNQDIPAISGKPRDYCRGDFRHDIGSYHLY